ncbi:hypothetical protein DEA98_09835 [Brucella pseudogrignonensis]|nr:hypothetical protein [Brucella pseudogrignonensis]
MLDPVSPVRLGAPVSRPDLGTAPAGFVFVDDEADEEEDLPELEPEPLLSFGFVQDSDVVYAPLAEKL